MKEAGEFDKLEAECGYKEMHQTKFYVCSRLSPAAQCYKCWLIV